MRRSPARRPVLRAVGLSLAVGLAGCAGRNRNSGGDTDDRTSTGFLTSEANDSDMADQENPDNPTAVLKTNHGDITVELFEERVPRTVDNFVGLATGQKEWTDPETGETKDGEPLYQDVLFHRIIEGFMIQGGDPTGTGRGGPGYQFDDEFHDELGHDGPGVLSMANSGPNTNGSQFFITLDAQPHLDGRHSVFGKVIDGMDVVREIGSTPTDRNDKPTEDVVLESVAIYR